MKRVTQEQLYNDLLASDLFRQPSQAGLILRGGHSISKLFAEFLCQGLLEPDGLLVVDLFPVAKLLKRFAELVFGQSLHADQEPAAVAFASGPSLDEAVDSFPTPEIEVADAEVGAIRYLYRLLQGRKQREIDVVEYPRQDYALPRSAVRSLIEVFNVSLMYHDLL